jgi:DNA repair exonuclease SbcCD ATPase subunit
VEEPKRTSGLTKVKSLFHNQHDTKKEIVTKSLPVKCGKKFFRFNRFNMSFEECNKPLKAATRPAAGTVASADGAAAPQQQQSAAAAAASQKKKQKKHPQQQNVDADASVAPTAGGNSAAASTAAVVVAGANKQDAAAVPGKNQKSAVASNQQTQQQQPQQQKKNSNNMSADAAVSDTLPKNTAGPKSNVVVSGVAAATARKEQQQSSSSAASSAFPSLESVEKDKELKSLRNDLSVAQRSLAAQKLTLEEARKAHAEAMKKKDEEIRALKENKPSCDKCPGLATELTQALTNFEAREKALKDAQTAYTSVATTNTKLQSEVDELKGKLKNSSTDAAAAARRYAERETATSAEIKKLKEELAESKTQHEIALASHKSTAERLDDLKKDYEKQIQLLNSAAEDNKNRFNDAKRSWQTLEGAMKKNTEDLTREVTDLNSKLSTANNELIQTSAKLQAEERKVTSMTAKTTVRSSQEQLQSAEVTRLNADLVYERSQNVKLRGQVSELESEKRRAANNISSLEVKLESLTQENETLEHQVATLFGEKKGLEDALKNKHSDLNKKSSWIENEIKKLEEQKDQTKQNELRAHSLMAEANLKSQTIEKICQSSTNFRKMMEDASKRALESAGNQAQNITDAASSIARAQLEYFERESGSMISGFLTIMSQSAVSREQITHGATQHFIATLGNQAIAAQQNMKQFVGSLQAATIVNTVRPAFSDFSKLMQYGQNMQQRFASDQNLARSFVAQLSLAHERAAIILLSLNDNQWRSINNPELVDKIRRRYIKQGNIILALATQYQVKDVVGSDTDANRIANNTFLNDNLGTLVEAVTHEPVPIVEEPDDDNNNNNNNTGARSPGRSSAGGNFRLTQ